MSAVLERARAVLLVIDVQEGFRKAIDGFEEVAHRAATLARGAAILGLPTVLTEQYPRGLGATVTAVTEAAGNAPPLEKIVFSAARAEGFDLAGRDQVLLCGIEAHVCVSQSALDLLGRGVEVQIAADATASRAAADRDIALHRLERAGAVITSSEAALFELLGAAGTPEFKEIQRLVL
ncbi:MAG: hydrolase [Solirubrobacteraceae bacterium]